MLGWNVVFVNEHELSSSGTCLLPKLGSWKIEVAVDTARKVGCDSEMAEAAVTAALGLFILPQELHCKR